MKLSEYNKAGNEYTARASDIVRQLAFAGIAVVWIFTTIGPDGYVLDSKLILPLLLLVLTLLFDLLQYVIGGDTWKRFFRRMERKARERGDHDPLVKAPSRYSAPIYFFYWGKITLILLSYLLIILYLIMKLEFV